MVDLFLGQTNALRPGWRAFLFYAATTAGYQLLPWVWPGFQALPRAAYPLGLFTVLLLVSWLFLALEGRSLASIGLRPGLPWVRDFGLGLGAGCAVILATALAAYAAGAFHLARGAGVPALARGLLLFLVPALSEELGFRGYLFQRVERSLGTWGGLVLMALLFALAHLPNPGMAGAVRFLGPLNIFLAGILLGQAYLGTRSLALPMGLHLGWNWAQGALLGFGVSGTSTPGCLAPVLRDRPLWVTGGAFGLEGSLACTACCLIACFILGRWRPARLVKHPFFKE